MSIDPVEITQAGIDRIKSVAGIDTYCVLKTMVDKNLPLKEALSAYKKYKGKLARAGELDPKKQQEFFDGIMKDQVKDKMQSYHTLMAYADHVENLADPKAMADPLEYLISTTQEVNKVMPFAAHNASDLGTAHAKEYTNVLIEMADTAGVRQDLASGKYDADVIEILSIWHDDPESAAYKDIMRKYPKESTAYKVAKVVQDFEDFRFGVLNAEGAHLPYRKNRVAGSALKSDTILRTPPKEFIADMIENLHDDLFSYPANASPEMKYVSRKKLAKQLREHYLELSDPSLNTIDSADFGNRSFLKRFEGARSIRFKDAAAFKVMTNKYGFGSVYETLVASSMTTGKTVGLMRRFGPDPDMGYKLLRNYIKDKFGGTHTDVANRLASADESYLMARGKYDKPGYTTKYDLTTVNLELAKASKYGLIGASAFKDYFNAIFLIRNITGGNTLTVAGKLMSRYFKLIGDPELRKKVAGQAGIVLDQHRGREFRRFADDPLSHNKVAARRLGEKYGPAVGNTAEFISRASDFVFKASLINPITDANLTTTLDVLGMELFSVRHQNMDQLWVGYKNAFKRAGISAKEWDLIRTANVDSSLGLNFNSVLSTHLKNPNHFGNVKQVKTIMNKFKMFMYDWGSSVVAQPGQRESAAFKFAAIAPDSYTHMVMRFAELGMKSVLKQGNTVLKGLYTGLDVNSMSDIITTKNIDGTRSLNKNGVKEIAWILANAATVSYAVDTLKNVAKGKRPDDPTLTDTWVKSLGTSGAFGLVTDVLFGAYGRYSSKPSQSLLGVGFGLPDDAFTLLSKFTEGKLTADQAGKILMRNIPGNNLWVMPLLIKYMSGQGSFTDEYIGNKR